MPRTTPDILADMRSFPPPANPMRDWGGFVDLFAELHAAGGLPSKIPDVLLYFERHPTAMLVANLWVVAHTLEHHFAGQFEAAVLESVLRRPSDFATRLASRIACHGRPEVDGVRVVLPWQVRCSQILCGSVLGTGMLEVTHDVAGEREQFQQEGMNLVGQFILVVGQACPVDIALEVIVQILVRVQFRGPARQEEHGNAVGVLLDPVPHLLAVVGAESVGDEIDLLGRLAQQPLQEHDEQRRVERAGVRGYPG